MGRGMVQEVLLNWLIPISCTEAFDPHFAGPTGLLAHGGRNGYINRFAFHRPDPYSPKSTSPNISSLEADPLK